MGEPYGDAFLDVIHGSVFQMCVLSRRYAYNKRYIWSTCQAVFELTLLIPGSLNW